MDDELLTPDEIRARLHPEDAEADGLLLLVLDALRAAGHPVAVTDAYGVGSESAAEVRIGSGPRMRITVQPW